jgi:hypothetical protein
VKADGKQVLGLFFNPEDGGDMFLGNVGLLSTDFTALIPEYRTLHESLYFGKHET